MSAASGLRHSPKQLCSRRFTFYDRSHLLNRLRRLSLARQPAIHGFQDWSPVASYGVSHSPCSHGDGVLRDLRSLTKTEAEGTSGHQLPSIPIGTLCLGQNRWFAMEQESWFCVPALPVQAV